MRNDAQRKCVLLCFTYRSRVAVSFARECERNSIHKVIDILILSFNKRTTHAIATVSEPIGIVFAQPFNAQMIAERAVAQMRSNINFDHYLRM